MVSADFIAFANPTWALGDGDADMHELFLSNFFAQTKALAFGKTSEEVRAEGTPEAIVADPDSVTGRFLMQERRDRLKRRG